MKDFGEAHENKFKKPHILLEDICSKCRRELSPVKLKHLHSKLKGKSTGASPNKVLVVFPK